MAYVCAAAQYVLLFLVRFNNSDRFQIYGVTNSSSSRHSYVLLVGRWGPYVHKGDLKMFCNFCLVLASVLVHTATGLAETN